MLRRCSLGWVITTSILVVALAVLLSTATFAPLAVAEAGDGESNAGALLAAGVRTLSTGAKVEILAIGSKSETEQPERWWRPDGTPLVSVPFRVGGGSVSPSDDQLVRQIVIRVPGLPPDATVRWRVIDLVGGSYWATVDVVGEESSPDYYGEVFCIAQQQAKFGLNVEVAAGKWTTVARQFPHGGSVGLLSHQGVVFSRAFSTSVPHWGEITAVVVTHSVLDRDVRVIAVDQHGQQHTAGRTSITSSGGSAANLKLMQLEFFGLKPDAIEHFEFQTRDFQSVQFNELPTQPDTNLPAVEFQALAPEVAPKAETIADDELAGHVVDEAGRPLAGVDVDAWTWFPGNETVTDDAGRFSLKGFNPREPVELQFTKPGFCPRHFIAQPVGKSDWVVTLNNRSYLEGRVLEPDGKPIAGINIRATRGPFKSTDGSGVAAVWTETETDAEGRYRMYLEPDTYELRVRRPGVGVARYENTVVAMDDHRELDLQLGTGPTFRARVYDSVTGEPVAGIRLFRWREPSIAGSSNDDGALMIVNMLPATTHAGGVRTRSKNGSGSI